MTKTQHELSSHTRKGTTISPEHKTQTTLIACPLNLDHIRKSCVRLDITMMSRLAWRGS